MMALVRALGPVFERERTVIARRRRFYVARSASVLVLLAVMVATGRASDGAIDPGTIAGVRFAAALFRNLLLVQVLAIVFLTPALVAGALAQEYQKRTLHELLASDLTSAEIVLGKLAARLAHVLVIGGTGLPLLIVTGYLGGVDPWLGTAALAATGTTALLLGGLSILASTQTRSVRGAMNFTLTITLAWLIVPAAVDVLLPLRGGQAGRAVHAWVGPVNGWLAATSPFSLGIDVIRGAVAGASGLRTRLVAMIVLQTMGGALLSALAVARLRPSFRARGEGRSRGRARQRHQTLKPVRPKPCGDDPMLWKELRTGAAPFQRPLVFVVVLLLGGVLAGLTAALAVPAGAEVLREGYGVAPAGSARVTFHSFLRIVGTGIALVYLLGVASDAAAGLTSERENETWISLIATPLTGTEIIRAKMRGAVWNLRHTALVLTLLWLLGVAVGSVHPLGLLAALAALAAFTGFTAALGTWISLHAQNTMQALGRVMASLLMLGGGSLLVTLPILAFRPLALVACGPWLLALALASPGDLQGRPASGSFGLMPDRMLAAIWVDHPGETVGALLMSVLGAALGAWALSWSACHGFDPCLDRPALTSATASSPGDPGGTAVPSRPRSRPRLRLRPRRPSLNRKC